MPVPDNRFAAVADEVASKANTRRPVLQDLNSVEPEVRCRLVSANVDGPFDPLPWLWAGRIPLHELTILAGRGEVGKTTLALDLAAQLSRGELRGALFGRKGKTIFFSDEASFERVIAPRYAAAGGEVESLYGIEFVETTATGAAITRPMDLVHTDIRLLAEQVEEEQIDLLIFDPIDMLLGRIDSHRNNEVRAALRLIMSAGCTVIGIQHVTKSSNVTHAGDRVMGSAAYRNVARSVLLAEGTHQDLIMLAQDKSNYGARQPSLSFKIVDSDIEGYGRVEWLDEVEASADDLFARRPRGPSLKEQCCSWLSEFLEVEGPTAPSDVLRSASAEGFKRTTTYEARRQLGVVTRDGRWTLG